MNYIELCYEAQINALDELDTMLFYEYEQGESINKESENDINAYCVQNEITFTKEGTMII